MATVREFRAVGGSAEFAVVASLSYRQTLADNSLLWCVRACVRASFDHKGTTKRIECFALLCWLADVMLAFAALLADVTLARLFGCLPACLLACVVACLLRGVCIRYVGTCSGEYIYMPRL